MTCHVAGITVQWGAGCPGRSMGLLLRQAGQAQALLWGTPRQKLEAQTLMLHALLLHSRMAQSQDMGLGPQCRLSVDLMRPGICVHVCVMYSSSLLLVQTYLTAPSMLALQE